MNVNENGYPSTPGIEKAAARVVAALASEDVTLKQEANLRAVIDAASWVVSLFGTDDPVGRMELRTEVNNLRNALRVFRRDDHPHVAVRRPHLPNET